MSDQKVGKKIQKQNKKDEKVKKMTKKTHFLSVFPRFSKKHHSLVFSLGFQKRSTFLELNVEWRGGGWHCYKEAK